MFFILGLGHWDLLLLLWGHSSSCEHNLNISTQLELQQKHNNGRYEKQITLTTKVKARIENKPEG